MNDSRIQKTFEGLVLTAVFFEASCAKPSDRITFPNIKTTAPNTGDSAASPASSSPVSGSNAGDNQTASAPSTPASQTVPAPAMKPSTPPLSPIPLVSPAPVASTPGVQANPGPLTGFVHTTWPKQNIAEYFPWSFKKLSHDKSLWTIPTKGTYDQVKSYINNGGIPPTQLYNGMMNFAKSNIRNGAAGLIWQQS